MVNANINGVGHNFIHNPFFRLQLINRLFGVTQSLACCFSQTMYNTMHMQHHKGNSDRPDETVTRLIGCRSTGTAMTSKPKIRGAMFF